MRQSYDIRATVANMSYSHIRCDRNVIMVAMSYFCRQNMSQISLEIVVNCSHPSEILALVHVIILLLIEWEFISIINCTCYSVTYMGTRPLNKGTNRPITLCTVKLFIQLMYNKNDHLAKWSIFLSDI